MSVLLGRSEMANDNAAPKNAIVRHQFSGNESSQGCSETAIIIRIENQSLQWLERYCCEALDNGNGSDAAQSKVSW